ncbi:host specificity factor TipJ family phage tail protein [Pandoraea bronchicola]|uniref:Uncharacterized protein n=1 Tax=Pandoraea bronchicola TaxID=2508287 RepID=A0A5E5BXQ0_9BURK|nr:host specificity factor TipJ family phage tail protein [Pandoraea bronchicola]VVE90394.1 hypothetical protein PBR20603_04378 [Pandoraea bronchicola]
MEVIERQAPALVHMPHPLTSDGRAVFYAGFLDDETIGDYLARHGVKLPYGAVSLWCNGIPVPSENWEHLIPQAGDRIVIRTTLEGGGGGVGKVLRTVALVAVAAFAPQLGAMAVSQFGGIGLAATLGANGILVANGLAAAAIMVGGSLLVNALLPPPRASFNSVNQPNSQTPTYSLTGGRNSVRQYEPMLVCVGYNKVVPDLASTPYTEFYDHKQYLYQAFHFGLSDVTLSDFKIGDTPIGSYEDVSIEVSGADGKLSLIAGNVDSQNVQDLSAGTGWVQRTTSVDTIAIAVDIVATLYHVNDQGGLDSRSVAFQMQYRVAGTGNWLDFGGGVVTITGATQSPQRYTFRGYVARGQFDVRVQKLTEDAADSRDSNAVSWSQLRSYQQDSGDYTGQTRVGVRILASAQLNGSIDTFSAMATAVCPVWTGTSWVTKATSNPGWWFLWWARGKFINGRRIYGAGLPDSRIDIEGIKEFAAYCDSKGLTVNFVQGAGLSIGAMADQIALCGDGSSTWLTGKLGVVWDAPDQPSVMQFGPFNIKRDSFQVEYNTENLADEIIVNFTNPDKGWVVDQVRAKPPNVTAPTNPVTLDFVGCTSVTLAGRKANLMAAGQYYHRRKVTWVSDLEGFVAQRGDVVELSHDMTAWSYSGRLLGGDRDTLRLDRSVPLAQTQGYVGVRFPDGTYRVFGVNGGAGMSDTLKLTRGIPAELPVPDEHAEMVPYDWVFVYDPLATPGKRVKITSVTPQSGGNEVQIIATDEEAGYYAAAAGGYDYVPPRQYSHLNGDVLSLMFNEQLLDGATGRTRVILSWTTGVPTKASVFVSIDDGPPTRYEVDGNSLEIQAYSNDVVQASVQPAPLVQLQQSAQGKSGRYVVQGLLQALATPRNVSTVYRDQLTHVIWSEVVDPRAIDYEVRQGATWQSASLVVNTPVTDIVAVGDGTYWIATRYQSPIGSVLYSPPASIVIAGASLVRNVIAVHEEAPDWSGTLTGGAAVNGGVLILAGQGDILSETNVLGVPNVLEYGGVAGAGSYTIPTSHEIDIGRVAACQLLITSSVHGIRSTENILAAINVFDNPDVLGEALGLSVSAKPQIAVAQADGVFGPWRDFLPGIYSGRKFTARLLLESTDPAIHPAVDQFSFAVDVPDRLDTGTNVPVAAGGATVTFASSFNAGPNADPQPHVQITLLNAIAGDQVVLTNSTLAGFNVKVVNGSADVARSINWSAQGY